MIDRLMSIVSETEKKAHVRAVFGEPQTVGDRTVIPVAEVRYRYWLGFGHGRRSARGEESQADRTEECGPGDAGGAGGGVGLVARPVAVVEVTKDGLQLVPVCDSTRLTLAGMALGAYSIFVLTRLIRRFAR